MGLIKDTEEGQKPEQTREDLERALKGKFVTCKVQHRDAKTDALVCNVFVQRPPEDSV